MTNKNKKIFGVMITLILVVSIFAVRKNFNNKKDADAGNDIEKEVIEREVEEDKKEIPEIKKPGEKTIEKDTETDTDARDDSIKETVDDEGNKVIHQPAPNPDTSKKNNEVEKPPVTKKEQKPAPKPENKPVSKPNPPANKPTTKPPTNKPVTKPPTNNGGNGGSDNPFLNAPPTNRDPSHAGENTQPGDPMPGNGDKF